MREVMFNGPENGKIEGRYYHSNDANAPVALILHPHPVHGGTMNNKVTYTAFHTFVNHRFSVLRFNFRGVGKSTGTFDNGVGELLDAATALDWLQLHNPRASSYWVIGFSFGAWIALQLLMRRPEITNFIVLAPPAESYDFNFLSPCPAPGLFIQGTQDSIVPESSVIKLYEKLDKQKNSDLEYVSIHGADHFFKEQSEELEETISSYIEPRLLMHKMPKKIKRDRRRRQTLSEI